MRTAANDARNSADVIIMPVSDDDQANGRFGIDADLFQVTESRRIAGIIYAGIHYGPFSLPKVQDGTFPIARSQERKLELVRSRWRYVQRIVSACS